MSREAMQMALEALESVTGNFTRTPSTLRDSEVRGEAHKAITVLRQALVDADDTSQKRVDEKAKRKQEPVAWISDSPTKGNGKQLHWTKAEAFRWSSNITPLYTAPPKCEWVGLHGSEVPDTYKYDVMFMEGWLWAEERLKEKNT